MSSYLPDLSDNKRKIAVVAGVSLASVGLYYLFRGSPDTKKKGKRRKKKQRLPHYEPVTKETLVLFFQDICKQMRQVLMQIGQQEAKIRQQMAAQGQQVSEEEMLAFCQNQLETMMQKREPEVYVKHKTNEEDIKTASQAFADDPAFKKVIGELGKLAAVVQPRKPVAVPETFALDTLISFMSELMEAMNCAMERTCEEVKSTGQEFPDTKAYQKMLNVKFNPRVQELSAQMLAKFKIDNRVLQAAMIKYNDDPRLKEKMDELGREQKRRFEKCGLKIQG